MTTGFWDLTAIAVVIVQGSADPAAARCYQAAMRRSFARLTVTNEPAAVADAQL